MDTIPDGSVDMVLCDLPYGTTRNSWDIPIPFGPLWKQWSRVCKENAAIVLFAQMPFAASLVMSNPREFRYEWIFEKAIATGFLNARRAPLKAHENIAVFYRKLPTYNPQFTYSTPYKASAPTRRTSNYGKFVRMPTISPEDGRRYPRDVLKAGTGWPKDGKGLHPTQKPVALLEYLIKTYTNPGEIVLDNCMGSGSTGVAAVNTDRGFIGIELDPNYYNIAERRIMEAREAHDRQRAAAPDQG